MTSVKPLGDLRRIRGGPSEDPRETSGDFWRTLEGPLRNPLGTLGDPSEDPRGSRTRTSSEIEEVWGEPEGPWEDPRDTLGGPLGRPLEDLRRTIVGRVEIPWRTAGGNTREALGGPFRTFSRYLTRDV